MAIVISTGASNLSRSFTGAISSIYIRGSNYSTQYDNKLNLSSMKRGTGGRSSFNGMVATVFGCSGFVGQYVCGRLGRIGAQMILPYRCDHYNMMPYKCMGDLGQVLFHEFDLRDQKSIEEAVKYSNVVINLIGRDYETKNFKYDDVHVKGARNIARACTKMGVDRLIHLSYLNSAENPEEVVIKGGSNFKRSKWLGEQAVKEEYPTATIIKASDIYGGEDRFLNAFGHWWRRWHNQVPLWKNGENIFKQPIYVTDVAQGIINAAKDPDTRGHIYQAVGPKRYEMKELVDYFFRVMRRDSEIWGYTRYDMCWDPIFQLKISFTEKISPGYPFGYLHWESIERESTTDVVKARVPTLEDLGVKLTEIEHQAPWDLVIHRAFAYYMDELGEFQKPKPAPTVPMTTQ